jgi:hypothetical protein
MPTNTYVALATQTLASAASSVIFNSIPQGYTDLVLVAQPKNTTQAAVFTASLFFNADTGTSSTNYSNTWMYGTGSTAASFRWTSSSPAHGVPYGGGTTNFNNIGIVNIMNYSNATTFKTAITRYQEDSAVYSLVSLWRNTAPITSITLYPGDAGSNTLAAGSTFTIYGIKAQVTPGTAKATGGTISYDNFGNVYHTFTSGGTFTPTQSLTADILTIAGGGGGGGEFGGGGGAGGLLYTSGASLTAVGYTVTVGAGGAGTISSQAGNGTSSIFSSYTAIGGGSGGGNSNTYAARTGGSGGGGSRGGSGAAGTSGQGFAGGTANGGETGAGGGGAGAVGVNSVSSGVGSAGGAGSNAYSAFAVATSTGVSNYYAGGGGGAGYAGISGAGGAGGIGGGGNGGGTNSSIAAGAPGSANTGGGGGGGSYIGGVGNYTGGNGGSGLVIIRYAG